MTDSIDFEFGPQFIHTWARLDYTVWFAIAEMVDNSLQAYLNNQAVLDADFLQNRDRLRVDITYDAGTGMLSVLDNSMGMNAEELRNALKVGRPPQFTGGLSEFGMGLKTSGVWLSDLWKVRTKKLGERLEYEITFDTNAIAAGNTVLVLSEREMPENQHYTLIEFESIRKKIHAKTLSRTKSWLGSIYRLQSRDRIMELTWNDEVLTYDESLQILKATDPAQTPYKRDFDFEVNGKRAHGWCAVLSTGGRPKAGFAVFRRGRIFYGQPNAWRPTTLYGQDAGSNDTVNQRLVGEIHLDNFVPSHTKNAILWQDDEEELLEQKLIELFADYRVKSKEKVGGLGSGPSPQTMDIALDQLREALTNSKFIDAIQLTEVPSKEVIDAANAPIIEEVRQSEAALEFTINSSVRVKVFLKDDLHTLDPYFIKESPELNEIIIVLNMAHPFVKNNLSDSESLLIYMLMCCYDAIAEWKCEFATHEIEPGTVRQIKDQYMRLNIDI